MSRLKMRTKTDPQPRALNSALCRNLSRVYFSAHPADYAKYLDALAKEIYRTHDCAFCFDSRPDEPYDEEILEDLQTMHLFVLPITTRLLTDSAALRALEQVLSIANTHNIPVLPLMQENGLEYLYNQTEPLKNLQFLSPYDKSEAALPYENKLKASLDAILLDPQTAEEVRKAFPARIFLSYRKKDRKLAQNLRQTIHACNVLRDVAIWYDELLTPGEDFNQNIRQALEGAHLFTLAVTDHLLEDGNYVIRYEYPAALELDKPVLPIEVAQTDRKKFTGTFLTAEQEDVQNRINKLVQPMTDLSSKLQETVQQNLEAALNRPLTENNDPHHLYQMGMAYLHGIDVEIDRERARELFLAAAKENDVRAMTRLAEMYQADAFTCGTDEAAEKCRKQSVHWTKEATRFYEDHYQAGDRRDELIQARLYAKHTLASKLLSTKDTRDAARAWNELRDIFRASQYEYPAEEDPTFFSQVYYHAALAALSVQDTNCLCNSRDLSRPHTSRTDAVKDYMDRSIELAAKQYDDDPAEQKKLLLKRYVAAGEFFARLSNNADAEEYFSRAFNLYPNPNQIEDREMLRWLAHLFFRQATQLGRSGGKDSLLQAETLLQKIPKKEKTAGDWHVESKIQMQRALNQYRVIEDGFVKDKATRKKMADKILRRVESACNAAELCVKLDGSTLASREDYCQILRESIILCRILKNEKMLQKCCADLRELTQSLLHCTGPKSLLKKLSDAFVSLARAQEKAISKARNTPKADVLLSQALQDCQTADDLLQDYETLGGKVPLIDSAGLEYERGILYQAADRHEEALQWFEKACTRLKAVPLRYDDENTLLQWCERDAAAARKRLR